MAGSSDDSHLWNLTLQHSPIGMALVAPAGQLLRVNPAMADMLGYSVEELTTRGFQEITHPDDLAADLGLVRRTLDGEQDSFRLRKRYVHAEGYVVWGDLSAALVRAPDGAPLHFISQILDVTEQEQQESRLRRVNQDLERERQALEAIFETVGVGLLLIGPDGRYERMNQRHQETMRLPFPDGHHGRAGQLGHVYRLDGKTPLTREEMPSYRAAQGEEFDDYSYWVGEDPLTRAAFSASARQLRSGSGERLGAALAYQDITDLMRAIRVKEQFVASVSHELRTPLTSVLGYLEVLGSREDLPDQVLRQLQVVRRNALRLESLVADLLHVGQADEGRLPLRRGRVDLALLVRQAAETARPLCAAASVALAVEVPAVLVAEVDEQRMRQVLDNLLSNAVKYTPAGGSVGVSLAQESDGLRIEVRDTGIGIAPDEVDQVFDRFFRGGDALDRQIPGTGLGLDIVSAIVEAHGGEVSLDSTLGEGSTFRVRLPLPEA